MALRDRGKVKWRPAAFMPLGFEMTRAMFKDQERKAKPLIDEYEAEEFDRQISYAREYQLLVRLSVWDEGFTTEVTGLIHSLDPIKHQLRLEVRAGEFEVIAFDKVIGVTVTD